MYTHRTLHPRACGQVCVPQNESIQIPILALLLSAVRFGARSPLLLSFWFHGYGKISWGLSTAEVASEPMFMFYSSSSETFKGRNEMCPQRAGSFPFSKIYKQAFLAQSLQFRNQLSSSPPSGRGQLLQRGKKKSCFLNLLQFTKHFQLLRGSKSSERVTLLLLPSRTYRSPQFKCLWEGGCV